MKSQKNKVSQVREADPEEQRRIEEQKQRREEESRQKREDYKELSERKKAQGEAAADAARKLAKKKSNSYLNYYIVFGVLGALCLYIIVMLILNQQAPLHKVPTIDEHKIEEHNSSSPWKQGPSKFFEGTTLSDAKRLINSSFASHSNLVRCSVEDNLNIPDSFDARQQWPNCVLPVGNQQKTCGSSYAFALTQAFSERLCINGKKLTKLSPQELLSCDVSNQGCKGGYLNTSLDYIKIKGLVTEECFPYQADSETVKCENMCPNQTRERIESYCILYGEDDIKKEILKNGPVVAVTQIHTDFLTYKSGVYQKTDEVPKFSGMSAVKIVGWNVEDGSEKEPNKGNKYWIVQNSWGEDWGENGYARISMGQELMFDQYAYSLKVKAEVKKAEENLDLDLDAEKK